MDQEKLKAALIKVRDNIQTMDDEKFREKLENSKNGDIFHALTSFQEFSDFLYDYYGKPEKFK